MKLFRNQLLLAAVFSVSMLLSVFAPAYAADIAGKTATAVAVTGNTTVPESSIMAVIKVKPGDTLTPDKINQDLHAIYELGYFFDVTANFTEVPEGVKVVYSVMENPALNNIIIKGNTKVSTDKLQSMLTIKKGSVVNTSTVNDNARAIEQYYHEQGYILAKVSDVAMGTDGVITITINEGMLEGIKIKGNDKTKDYVITREMKLKTGQPFNAKDAKRSMQKVYNLGYFEDVNMKLNPGRDPNAVVLETDVVEQKTGVFSIGGGYSQTDGLTGIIELGDDNFRGTGDKTKIHWEFGGNSYTSHNYQFSYTRPWINNNTQTSLSFDIYNMTNLYNDYDNAVWQSEYYRKRQGWDITVGRPQGEYVQNYITLKHRDDKYVAHYSGDINYGDGSHPDYLQNNFGVTRSVILSRVFDSRDNVFNATEGARTSLSAEFAGKLFGGDFNFNKYNVEARKYFKVGHDQTIAVRTDLGYATGRMPDSGKFTVGGIDTLRGYDDDEFKGNKMLTASAEYRFPIAKKVQGVLFTDIGNAWDGEGYKLDDLKSSVGIGIRLNTPLGPIRLDFAKGSQGNKTHFGFGGQF
ncbi:MAG: BamA/TamA family outer membrane protein [Pelosinus sp.]|nr:BamA/TamA family outer membrane protein [Pelosinus sp.]